MTEQLENRSSGLESGDAPFVREAQEPTGMAGVELFLHTYNHPQSSAPIRTSRFTIESGCRTHEDRHAVSELWLISRGTLDVAYDGRSFRVSAGQVVFFEPWKSHFTKNVGEHQAEVFSVWWTQA
ncbi:cupin domain-containing protein [Pseudomonas aeruginosa]|uniref:cupin domain-containing protein n=1 Tax=Pseudomonas aeruginosa TaxID=287 RepID=UPI003CC68ACE